jgi:uncharacterized membrane protein YbaN (DUF454 family)
MRRPLFLAAGIASVVLGAVGAILPVLPTVPFLILAAFCFARSNPRWEARLLEHPRWGPPIRDWRERGAISRKAKWVATVAMAGSAALALLTLPWPWAAVPLVPLAIAAAWIWTRPD